MPSRRAVIKATAAAGLGAAAGRAAAQPARDASGDAGTEERRHRITRTDFEPGVPGRDYRPVIAPNMTAAPSRIVDGRKVFHLTASEFTHRFAEGLEARCWGYNNQVNGPMLEAVEGDVIRVYLTNRLPAPTTLHWHGLILPHGMDGVSGLTQPPVPPGETWAYEIKLVQHGTFMFHSHHDTMTQEGMGLTGMLIIHPREPVRPRVDRDFAIILHEWMIDAGAARPNPNEMTDFNILTMNGRVFPDTEPMVARTGQRVRIRLANLSAMSHHPIHLHGHEFAVTATDGSPIPEAHQPRGVTVLVGVGQTRDIEFVAEPGDWAIHCHMTHHIMNQMGHDFPNLIGVRSEGFDERVRRLVPGYMTMGTAGMTDMTHSSMPIPPNSIPMKRAAGQFGETRISLGGMASVVKVRDDISDAALDENRDPGWFAQPEGSLARRATEEEMRRDSIRP